MLIDGGWDARLRDSGRRGWDAGVQPDVRSVPAAEAPLPRSRAVCGPTARRVSDDTPDHGFVHGDGSRCELADIGARPRLLDSHSSRRLVRHPRDSARRGPRGRARGRRAGRPLSPRRSGRDTHDGRARLALVRASSRRVSSRPPLACAHANDSQRWAADSVNNRRYVPPGDVSSECFRDAETLVAPSPQCTASQRPQLADAIDFLASTAAAYMTGGVLDLDGGWTAYSWSIPPAISEDLEKHFHTNASPSIRNGRTSPAVHVHRGAARGPAGLAGRVDHLEGDPLGPVRHVHDDAAEYYYVLSGACLVEVGGEERVATPATWSTSRPTHPTTSSARSVERLLDVRLVAPNFAATSGVRPISSRTESAKMTITRPLDGDDAASGNPFLAALVTVDRGQSQFRTSPTAELVYLVAEGSATSVRA